MFLQLVSLAIEGTRTGRRALLSFPRAGAFSFLAGGLWLRASIAPIAASTCLQVGCNAPSSATGAALPLDSQVYWDAFCHRLMRGVQVGTKDSLLLETGDFPSDLEPD